MSLSLGSDADESVGWTIIDRSNGRCEEGLEEPEVRTLQQLLEEDGRAYEVISPNDVSEVSNGE